MKLPSAQESGLRAEFSAHLEHIRRLAGEVDAGGQADFKDVLLKSLSDVESILTEADVLTNEYAAGRLDDINAVVLAVERADLALTFALKLRNKLLEAYQEITRMPV